MYSTQDEVTCLVKVQYHSEFNVGEDNARNLLCLELLETLICLELFRVEQSSCLVPVLKFY